MLLQGIGQCFGAVSDVVQAPFKLLGGLVNVAGGLVSLPFSLVGGLFGGGGATACRGAQAGLLPFV
ncbi:hypothetical protein L6R52_27305 [Myxococcota bacterium]|nr:hypothetical protein [Myxococcota bacterium]